MQVTPAHRKRIDTLKAELDELRPLRPEHVAALRSYFKIGLTYTSNALEGNSLTETETRVVIDGNGRTARLIMNLALLQDGYPVVIIPPILRREYLDTLEACHGVRGDPEPFFDFMARAAIESLRDYLRLLRTE